MCTHIQVVNLNLTSMSQTLPYLTLPVVPTTTPPGTGNLASTGPYSPLDSSPLPEST